MMLSIRVCREADLPSIQAIYAHYVRHGTASFELTPPDLAEMRQRVAAVQERGLPWLVALLEERIVGYAYAGPYRPRPAYRFTVEDSVYLDPAFTGRGFGRPLLEEVIERCVALGARQMVAVIGDSANHASIHLHERCGFRQVGVFRDVGWKFERWLDTVLMQRSLGSGASAPGTPIA